MPRPTKLMQEAKEMRKDAGKQLALANNILKVEKKKQEDKCYKGKTKAAVLPKSSK